MVHCLHQVTPGSREGRVRLQNNKLGLARRHTVLGFLFTSRDRQ